nr:hypothetical protein [Gammaproteobacteria bacterium]
MFARPKQVDRLDRRSEDAFAVVPRVTPRVAKMSRVAFRFSLVLAALVAVLVSAMNQDTVGIELAFWRLEASLGLALVVAFVVGMLAGLTWRTSWIASLLAERGRLRRALRIAEARARSDASGASETH